MLLLYIEILASMAVLLGIARLLRYAAPRLAAVFLVIALLPVLPFRAAYKHRKEQPRTAVFLYCAYGLLYAVLLTCLLLS